MTDITLEQNMAAARQEYLVPGREIHLKNMRGYRFCEIGLITGTSQDNAVTSIWNTTGASDPTPEQFAALDADAIAKETGALQVWLNPVRYWMFDEFDVYEVGEDRTFGGITGTWMGVVGAQDIMKATVQGSYYPGYIHRNNMFTFNEGSEVYRLDAPSGEVFVMQSFTPYWDPTLSEENLDQLGRRLELPGGWSFYPAVLDRKLTVSTAAHDHLGHILQDNLHNIYQGSDEGRAFSYIP